MDNQESWSGHSYDVIIIGGGINGAAIARDAALRGYEVLLLEKSDFAQGASSASSKLAHGGLRYLEYFHFGLVRESLRERELLLQNASHLVKPLPFIFPVFKGDKRPLWQIKLGLKFYDWLAKGTSMPSHQIMNEAVIYEKVPGLKSDCIGGALYYDAQMEDSRIVLENILSAEEAGATVRNYCEVLEITKNNNRVTGIIYKDSNTENQGEIKANLVIKALGPWTNSLADDVKNNKKVMVRPTKGVHLVFPDLGLKTAFILSAPGDNRIFFVIPWCNRTLIGTTDTDYQDDPDRIVVREDDIDYIINAAKHYFPGLPITREKMLASFAGLRPLVDAGFKNESSVSREHVCRVEYPGLLTVAGGKFTTFRHVAEKTVDLFIKFSKKSGIGKCTTAQKPLYGAGDHGYINGSRLFNEAVIKYNISSEELGNLVKRYGSATNDVLKCIEGTPGGNKHLCNYHQHLNGEISYAINREKVQHLADWFYRRTYIAWSWCRGLDCCEKTAEIFQSLLGWTKKEKDQELQNYQGLVKKMRVIQN